MTRDLDPNGENVVKTVNFEENDGELYGKLALAFLKASLMANIEKMLEKEVSKEAESES